jgi:putative membrane protein
MTMAITGLLVSAAVAQQSQANRLQTGDTNFVTKAGEGGMAEVELGRLAVDKATNPKVKQFGQRMIDDHTKINDELKKLCSDKGITAPTAISAADQSQKDKLSGLSGAAFDHAYMENMVSDHKHDISEFEHEASHGTDPDVKAFASKTLPTLREHLQLAEQTLAEVKK